MEKHFVVTLILNDKKASDDKNVNMIVKEAIDAYFLSLYGIEIINMSVSEETE